MASLPRVLFVCWGNTCRGVLAKHIGRHMFGERAHFDSAGIHPQAPEDARMAIKTLKKQYGIDASGHLPADIRFVSLSTYNLIVALDRDVAEALEIPPGIVFEAWDVRDPYGHPSEYVSCGQKIEEELTALIGRLQPIQ